MTVPPVVPVDVTVPCPICAQTIPYGGGVQRDGARLHHWCAVDYKPNAEGETRLKSGAYV